MSKHLERGFSLVEAMISMGLLSVAIYFGMDFIGNQHKSRDTRTKQSMHRYIAIQVTQHVNTNIAFYPPITPMGSDKILYVGCVTKDGVLINNKFQFFRSTSFNESVSTGLCTPPTAAYEVRFFWILLNNENPNNPDSNSVKINLLTLAPNTPTALTVHNFKIFAK